MNTGKNKKRVLFILPSLVGGGAEKVVIQLLSNLNREKYIPVVVLFERKGELFEDIPDDVVVYDLKKKNRYSFPMLIYKLARIIRDTSPSLIVSFLIYSNFVALLARKIALKNIPVVITEHSNPMFDMKNGRGYLLGYLLRKWFYKVLYPRGERIITVSDGIKKELITCWGIPSHKVIVVHNAIDLDAIGKLSKEPIKFQNNREIPRVIAVGRLAEQKGYLYLLKAIKMVREITPVQLLVLGDGEKKNELINVATSLNIYEIVSFAGFNKNPYKYMSNSTIFVLSSLWESFSIVIIEAMACGVPIISTRCPYGPEEIITDGVNGWLVPVGDEKALAEAIIKLLDNLPLRNKLVEAGKIRAKDFSIKKMVSGYEKVFSDLIG